MAGRNLKITWTAEQGWIVFDRAAFLHHSTAGFPRLPALFEAGDGPGASRLCNAWIDAAERAT